MGCADTSMFPMRDDGESMCVQCYKKSKVNLSIDTNIVHSSHSPYLGSFFFASPMNKTNLQHNPNNDYTSAESDLQTSSTVSSDEDQIFFPEQESFQRYKKTRPIENASNTLPSFRRGCPLHLKIIENCRANNSMSYDNFSYDPDLSSGEYVIQTSNGAPYGGGLRFKLGAQFSWLGDQWGRVLAATWSRRTKCPSHIIYSAKPFFQGQQHSTQRSVSPPSDRDDSDFRLYPWALLRKEGPAIEDAVNLYLVDVHASQKTGKANESFATTYSEQNESICGSIFCKEPSYQSITKLQEGIHSQTIVSRLKAYKSPDQYAKHHKNSRKESEKALPCAFVLRDPLIFDVFDVTIAPGIDPLLIICCLTVHTRMDLEIMLGQTRFQNERIGMV